MAIHKKDKRYWVYLSEENQARLAKLVEQAEPLGEVELLSLITASALKAIEKGGGKIDLPLKMVILREVDPDILSRAE